MACSDFLRDSGGGGGLRRCHQTTRRPTPLRVRNRLLQQRQRQRVTVPALVVVDHATAHCHKVLQQLQSIYQLSSVKLTKIPPGEPLKIFQSKDTDFKSAIPSAEHYKKEQGEEKCTSGGDGEFDQYRCVQPPPRPGAAEAAREGPWRPWRRPLKATFILQCGTHHTPSPGRPLQ